MTLQATTLSMVVRLVDQATAPLEKVTQKTDALDSTIGDLRKQFASLRAEAASLKALERTSTTLNGVAGSADTVRSKIDLSTASFKALGRQAAGLADVFGPLGYQIASVTRFLGTGGLVGVAGLASLGLIELVKWLKATHDEHERLQRVASRLDLPVRQVEGYSKAWLSVAIALNEAARGFTDLKESQERAFSALGVDPKQAGAQNAALTRIAAASGTKQEKIDVLKIVTGLSTEDAEKELDKELRRLGEFTNTARRRRVTKAEAEGVQFGAEDIGFLRRTGIISTENEIQDRDKRSKELERQLADITAAQERASKEQNEIQRKADEAHLNDVRIRMQREEQAYDEQLKARREQLDMERKLVDEFGDDVNSRLQKMADQAAESIGEIQYPLKDFEDAFKSALGNAITFADFSFKHLIERIILTLAQKRLFDAIDKLGDALTKALSGGKGGGGLLAGIGSFFGSILGGKASGGIIGRNAEVVGEDGPEVVSGGINSLRVFNRRQLAFAGAGGDGGGRHTYVYAPVHNEQISGIETAAVIGYIDRTRRADHEEWARRLNDNGFGRIR